MRPTAAHRHPTGINHNPPRYPTVAPAAAPPTPGRPPTPEHSWRSREKYLPARRLSDIPPPVGLPAPGQNLSRRLTVTPAGVALPPALASIARSVRKAAAHNRRKDPLPVSKWPAASADRTIPQEADARLMPARCEPSRRADCAQKPVPPQRYRDPPIFAGAPRWPRRTAVAARRSLSVGATTPPGRIPPKPIARCRAEMPTAAA